MSIVHVLPSLFASLARGEFKIMLCKKLGLFGNLLDRQSIEGSKGQKRHALFQQRREESDSSMRQRIKQQKEVVRGRPI